jgi:hypothetical protein
MTTTTTMTMAFHCLKCCPLAYHQLPLQQLRRPTPSLVTQRGRLWLQGAWMAAVIMRAANLYIDSVPVIMRAAKKKAAAAAAAHQQQPQQQVP